MRAKGDGLRRARNSIYFFAVSLIFMAKLTSFAQSGSPVSFTLDRVIVSVGEPVLVRVHIHNTTSQILELDLGDNAKDNIVVSVIDPTGNRNEKRPPPPTNGGEMTSFGWKRLGPGKDYAETLVLNEWFDFKNPGKYQVEIRLKEPATLDKQSLPTPTFSLNLEVTVYDLVRLESACKNLAAEVVHPLPGQNSLGATQALELVHDPNLVPFWSQLLKSTHNQSLQEISVRNLAYVRNQQSVEGLAEALRSHDKDTRSLARSALERIAAEASDPIVRSMAHDALDSR
jgi:hypothetical protein